MAKSKSGAKADLINSFTPGELEGQLQAFLSLDRYFSPQDWIERYGIKVPERITLPVDLVKLAVLVNEPCPFVKGKTVKQTHYLFYMPPDFSGRPLNVMAWQGVSSKGGQPLISDHQMGDLYPFAVDIARNSWYLMFEEVVPSMVSKTFNEQLKLKPETYDVSKIIECASMHFLVFDKNGYHLNESKYGRTWDRDDDGSYFASGNFDKFGFSLNDRYYLNSDREPELGIFLHRRLEQ